MDDSIAVTYDMGGPGEQTLSVKFHREVARGGRGGYSHGVSATWDTTLTEPPKLSDPRGMIVGTQRPYEPRTEWEAVYALPGAVAHVGVYGGCVTARSHGDSHEAAHRLVAAIKKAVPSTAPEEGKVKVTFWSYGRGPVSVRRDLDAPTWAEIEGNYAHATRKALSAMLDRGPDGAPAGKLALWAGPPGTGKTTALRALAREWTGTAELHYITDPEKFFGSAADYMMGVMMDQEDDGPLRFSGDGFEEDEARKNKHRILVLEDTGELLKTDAKQETGQALSRFLNAVDGLIGQGLRITVLVTTNEEVGKLHPAVTRYGRCSTRIAFTMLSREEADEWQDRHGIAEDERTGARTLAALYGHLAGADVTDDERLVGFAT